MRSTITVSEVFLLLPSSGLAGYGWYVQSSFRFFSAGRRSGLLGCLILRSSVDGFSYVRVSTVQSGTDPNEDVVDFIRSPSEFGHRGSADLCGLLELGLSHVTVLSPQLVLVQNVSERIFSDLELLGCRQAGDGVSRRVDS